MARTTSPTKSPPPPSPWRASPPVDPVTVTLDGVPVLAERGAPLADAFVAAGKLTLARSPKFHRPRGPSCFRAACDGCLARVDETPNVMTCMVPAEEGTAVVTQNRIGPREGDLLRMTDWFFPDGMNHHELFAGIPGVQTVMQAFARRVAGLGKLPSEALPARPASRRSIDALVVGAGPSGMAIATRLSELGRRVVVVDDQLKHGGGIDALEGEGFVRIRRAFEGAVAKGSVELRTRTVVGGIYRDDLLVAGEDGAAIVTAGVTVLACGGHDGVLAFEGNDIPGILSARAAGLLLSRNVLVGRRIAVVIPPGGGPFGANFARTLERRTGPELADVEVTVVHGEPMEARGSNRVSSVIVRSKEGEHEIIADAVVIDAPRAPAYELAVQVGARVVHEPRGFVVSTDAGLVRDGVYAGGELVGTPLDAGAITQEASRVAARIQADRPR